MNRDRFVLLGLGRARSQWFADVASWTTSGALSALFTKCVSVGEVRQKLSGLQPYSALLIEADITGLDRDLIDAATLAGASVFVVDGRAERTSHWLDLGAAAVLAPTFAPADLQYALSTHARVIAPAAIDVSRVIEEQTSGFGALIAVCGPGGTGASSVAIAIAQGIADDVSQSDLVVLADLARNSEQAMLHDAPDVVPGIEELVEANRTRSPAVGDVRSLTFDIVARRYRLLLGTRRSTAWSSMPPRAIDQSIKALRRAFRTVVCDVTADFESERDGGSADVEERNALARTAVSNADVVVVTGGAGMKGAHSLARTVRELLSSGVDASRILCVVTRAPKDRSSRSELTAAIAQLIQTSGSSVRLVNPIFVPDKPVDDLLRDGARLPKQLTEPVTTAVLDIVRVANAVTVGAAEHYETVKPGSLGLLDEAI